MSSSCCRVLVPVDQLGVRPGDRDVGCDRQDLVNRVRHHEETQQAALLELATAADRVDDSKTGADRAGLLSALDHRRFVARTHRSGGLLSTWQIASAARMTPLDEVERA